MKKTFQKTGVLHTSPRGDNTNGCKSLMNLPFVDSGSIGGEVHAARNWDFWTSGTSSTEYSREQTRDEEREDS